MERLTTERSWEEAEDDLWNECGYSDIWKRLNEIENILGKEYDIDRLREMIEADRAGRCMVLPCEAGDKVWFKDIDGQIIHEVVLKFGCRGETWSINFGADDIGKTVFLTREDAEAAMKGENYHE